MKNLISFDFDHTIIDDNSDTWVAKCSDKMLPDWLENSCRRGFWTEYMGRVFSYLGDQGIGAAEMETIMTSIPYTPGMIELLTFIADHKDSFDCIIISDSNVVFIDWILKAANLQGAIDKVFSNPAVFDNRGYLTVQCFHSHDCIECPVNLCKRKVLEDFLNHSKQQGLQYSKIIYVGDGRNDLCPLKCLKENDIAMPRKGYALDKLVSRICEHSLCLKPFVKVWSSGSEILFHLKQLI